MEKEFLDWYDEDSTNFDLDLGHAVDVHIFILWKAFGKESRRILNENLNILPAHDIKLYIVHLCNLMKGGKDVIRRQLKNIKVDSRLLSPQSFLLFVKL